MILLLISHLYYNDIQKFTLQCDQMYILDNLKRITSAFKEIILYFERYEVYLILHNLDRNIKRLKKRQVKDGFDIKIVRIDEEFIHLKINTTYKERFTLFLWNKETLSYVSEFHRVFNGFINIHSKLIKLEIHGMEDGIFYEKELSIEFDYSLNALYKYGIHCCDVKYTFGTHKNECIHIVNDILSTKQDSSSNKNTSKELKLNSNEMKLTSSSNKNNSLDLFTKETYNNLLSISFNLKIEFEITLIPQYRERLKYMTIKIYKLIKENRSLIIICPDRKDVDETTFYLNTKIILGNNSDNFEMNSKSFHITTLDELKRNINSNSLLDFMNNKKLKTIVFEGCYKNDEYYSIYEICKISHMSNVLIYESRVFIRYLEHTLS